MKILTFIILSIALSCGGSKNVPTTTSNEKQSYKKPVMNNSQKQPFEVLIQDASGGPTEPQILVIKEPKALQQFYTKINMTRRPGYPIPKVDFEKEMIVVLCMGEKTSGGYSINIDSIEELSDTKRVWVKETAPSGMATMAITQPFCVVKMPATDKKMSFEKMIASK